MAVLLFREVAILFKPEIGGDLTLQKLYAIVCLQIAAKLEGRYEGFGFGAVAGKASLKTGLLCPLNIIRSLNFSYEIEKIAETEQKILSTLNFKLSLSTPLELANLMLFLADPTFDYSVINDKLTSILTFCLVDSDLALTSHFTSFSLALASIIVTLDRLRWHQFLNDFITFMSYSESDGKDLNRIAPSVFGV